MRRSRCGAGTRSGRPTTSPIIVDGAEPQGDETSFASFLADATGTDPAAPPDAEALAVVLYTSGTSGKPRGAMLSHRALIANIEQVAALDPPAVTSDDVCLGLLPMFHIYGLNCVLGQAVKQGASVVLVDGFDPGGLLDQIKAEGVTNLPLAPPVVAAWAGRDDLRDKLAGVNLILSGASTLDPELADSFFSSSGKHIEQGYGLTETAPVIAVTMGARVPRTAVLAVARSVVRCRASTYALSRRAAMTPRQAIRPRSGSAATTCSTATGPMASTVRARTVGTPPATSAISTRRAT